MIENISLSSKLEGRVDCFVCRWNYSCRQSHFKPLWFALLWACCNNHYNTLHFWRANVATYAVIYVFLRLLIWWWKEPLRQSKVKPCLEISLSQQCLWESLFISYHTIMQFICWKTFLYFKLIHIGVKIQSQLRSLVTSVDNSIVADNIEFAGDIFYVL